MSDHRKSRFDSKYKGWRGRVMERTSYKESDNRDNFTMPVPRRGSHFNSKHKSWWGPVRERSGTEGSNNRDKNCFHNANPSTQPRQSENQDIEQYRARIKRAIKTACLDIAPPLTPHATSAPVFTCSPPPIEDQRKRRAAFDYVRPSRIYPDDSEEMCSLRRRSHLLFDELERERQGNRVLKKQVIRLRDKYGRIRYLVKEIDDLQRENEALLRAIQRARQANASQLN